MHSERRLPAAALLLLWTGILVAAAPATGEETLTSKARGTFDVKMTPHETAHAGKDSAGGQLARLALDKQFHGDLEAQSRGEMLSYGNPASGSAGYVAIEKVSGTLGGRSGTFALQHSGTMDRGAPSLAVSVVPDSGTGELEGLKGKMEIEIEQGGHFYTFHYSLPAAP